MTHGWRRWRVLILLGLVLMVLVRLVWMQLRHYPLIPDVRSLASYTIVTNRFDGECRSFRQVWRALPEHPEHAAGNPSGATVAVQSWLATPGGVLLGSLACATDLPSEVFFIRLNQWLLIGTVLSAAFLTRFITSSWTAAAVVATVLLSRGRFLTDLGLVSNRSILQFCLTLWLASWAHYFRTGSPVTAVVASLTALLGGLFDGVALVLPLAMPAFLVLGFNLRKRLARPMIRRFRIQPGDLVEVARQGSTSTDRDTFLKRTGQTVRWLLGTEGPTLMRRPSLRPDYRQGGIFVTLKVPFLLWASYRRCWIRILGWGVMGFVVSVVMFFSAKRLIVGSMGLSVVTLPQEILHQALQQVLGLGWQEAWFKTWLTYADTHYSMSLVVLLICALLSPARGLPAYWETVWLVLIAFVSLALASILGDVIDAVLITAAREMQPGVLDSTAMSQPPVRDFLSWIEPVVLSLAVAGIYNLIEVFDSRAAVTLHSARKVRGKL